MRLWPMKFKKFGRIVDGAMGRLQLVCPVRNETPENDFAALQAELAAITDVEAELHARKIRLLKKLFPSSLAKPEPLWSVEDTFAFLNIGRSTFYRLIDNPAKGFPKPAIIDPPRWIPDDVRAWLKL